MRARRRPILLMALAAFVAGTTLAAQKKDDKKPSAAQAKEIQAAISIVDDAAAGRAAPNEVGLDWVHEDYLKAQGRKEYVPFTVTIDPSKVSGGNLSLYWRVVSKNAPPPAKDDKKDPKKKIEYAYEDISTVPVATGQTPMTISRSFTVPAGNYDVYVLAKETAASTQKTAPKAAVLKHELSVPDFWNGDLSTSTVIVAERIDPLPAPLSGQQQADRPYALGTMEIVPSLKRSFAKTGELSTFMLIYNPKTDASNKPDVMVEYNFYAKPAGGPEKFFNKTDPQSLNASTLPPQFDLAAGHQLQAGQAVPLAIFPDGDYRLEIKVTDKIANKSLTREINFSVGRS